MKTTSSTRGHIHRIHGIDQLTPPQGGTLQLFSLRLREEPSAENTLVHLVNTISARLDSDPERLDRFEVALSEVGYSPMHAERYEEMRYRVVGERLYLVSASFPRLSPSSFTSGLPPGIERVEYEINLQGFDDLVVTSSPTEFSPPGGRTVR